MENKPQVLNYCRQVRKMFDKKILSLESYVGDEADEVKGVLLAYKMLANKKAVKFNLPINGIIIDDPEFKGLDTLSEVRLPYPNIILEYERSDDWYIDKKENAFYPKKIILACQEFVELKIIIVACWGYVEDQKLWAPAPPVIVHVDKAFRNGGDVAFGIRAKNQSTFDDYCDEIPVLYGLLNTLACSNVKIEKLPRRKPPKGKKMDVLPFDDYHVLTIATHSVKNSDGNYTESFGDRHAPREHLRRGHIRRLQDGRKIWVNAAVVNAGSISKVRKNYVAA